MAIREDLTAAVKASMLARNAERTSALRMIQAKLKDTDIAARPKGVEQIPDDEILAMLRSMIKSRRDSVALYRQGGREELAAKEEAEIAVISEFLPQTLEGDALNAAIAEAIAATGASSAKDMGKVVGALKAKHGAALDMGVASQAVKAALAG
ncbi:MULTISPECIES: GatB/YqeY domain-containing protein [Acidocella]|uniref:GatB/YqeY domain-containing protein n=1 Tax=Acidocella TaxID=50709 RepID=UPI00028EB222|nr:MULTISPECIES: GatB/YqeY domain-containing protein [Acidocella]EKN00043.1 GatB/Yqey domain-containing protein [Acidocella sp. MX-AZ02]WBO59597.1 GatB/YqeY domain-containing protein [Acidocella sp. MX-AZ03]